LNVRSAILPGVIALAFLLTIINYEHVSEPLRIPMFVGLAIVTSLAVLGLRRSQARPILAVLGMFLVTAIYLSYLHREVVIASVVITVIVTAITYARVAKEYVRRQQA
jgi:hypothetical protein